MDYFENKYLFRIFKIFGLSTFLSKLVFYVITNFSIVFKYFSLNFCPSIFLSSLFLRLLSLKSNGLCCSRLKIALCTIPFSILLLTIAFGMRVTIFQCSHSSGDACTLGGYRSIADPQQKLLIVHSMWEFKCWECWLLIADVWMYSGIYLPISLCGHTRIVQRQCWCSNVQRIDTNEMNSYESNVGVKLCCRWMVKFHILFSILTAYKTTNVVQHFLNL